MIITHVNARHSLTSLWLNPTASILTRICPSPRGGISLSSSTASNLYGPLWSAAFRRTIDLQRWGTFPRAMVSWNLCHRVEVCVLPLGNQWVTNLMLGDRTYFTSMSRPLRSRRSRPNYAALHTGEDVAVYFPDPEELESGSEFAASDSGVDGVPDVQDNEVEPGAGGFDDEAGPSSKAVPQVKKPKLKSQGPSAKQQKSVLVGLSKQSKSTPSTTHHRHRPPPLFRRGAQVERLLDPPVLFQPSATVLTNSFTSSIRTTKRLERTWGRNVGPGPVHEVLEDRAWFKEALPDASVTSEAGRRPVVYNTIQLDGRYHVISERLVFSTSIYLY